MSSGTCTHAHEHTHTRMHACIPALSGVPGPSREEFGQEWVLGPLIPAGGHCPGRWCWGCGRNSGPITEPYLPPSPFRFCFRGCYHCGSGERHNVTLSGKIKFKEAKGSVRIRTCEDQRASSGCSHKNSSTVLTRTTFSRKERGTGTKLLGSRRARRALL